MNQTATRTHAADGSQPDQSARNLRLAFAVVGALIGDGVIPVDLNDPDWSTTLKLHVRTVTVVLDELS